MVNRKIVYIVFCITFLSRSAFALEKGTLDLPDILVWGEDRSELPGLDERDIFSSPYLKKYNFVDPLRIDDPAKINPKDYYYHKMSGLKIISGFGSKWDYILRLIHGKNDKNKLFYDYDVLGYKKDIENNNFDYSNLVGRINIGGDFENWGVKGGFSGVTEDSEFERSLYRAEIDGFLSFDRLIVNPIILYDDVKVEDREGRELNFLIKARTSILYDQWITTELVLNDSEFDATGRAFSEIKVLYINSLFRDFSFAVNGGYRNVSENGITYGGRITGNIADTDYTLYFERDNVDRDLFFLLRSYPYLRLASMYDTELRSVLGCVVSKNLMGFVKLGVDVKYQSIENYLLLLDTANGLFPGNCSRETNISEAKIALEKNWFAAEAVLRNPNRDISYVFNEFKLLLSPEICLTGNKKFNLETVAKYVDAHCVLNDVDGISKTEIDEYWQLNMGVSCMLMQDLFLKFGGENLLSSKVIVPGGFCEETPRYYIVAELGFLKRKYR